MSDQHRNVNSRRQFDGLFALIHTALTPLNQNWRVLSYVKQFPLLAEKCHWQKGKDCKNHGTFRLHHFYILSMKTYDQETGAGEIQDIFFKLTACA